MDAIPRQGKSLAYLAVHPDGYNPDSNYPVIILLHGLGAHMGDLAGLAPYIDQEGYVYICPNAPIPMEIGTGMIGYAWRAPSSIPAEQLPPNLPDPEELLESFFQEIIEEYHVEPGRAILLGFSQGGGLTYTLGLPRPEIFAGLVALSCSIQNPELLKERLPLQRVQPLFIAHGTMDNPDRARQARSFLEQEGYQPWYREYAMAHEISPEVIEDLVPWVHQVLPPGAKLWLPG